MTTEFWTDPVSWCLIVGLAGAVALMVRERGRRSSLQERYDASQASELDQAQANQLAVDETARRVEERMNHALQAVMRTLQVDAGAMQRVVSDAEMKFSDPDMLKALLEFDHLTEQVTRRVQAVAVLCGGYLGRRRREPSSVYDVIRAARGRIQDYTRVSISPPQDYAIHGRYVEPLAAVLAELLDNASRYSTSQTPIDVEIKPVGTGICITIDDGGIGMTDEERDRAAQLLSGTATTSILDLGDPPKIGFAVIGQLAKESGFSVSVDRMSSYGGVRAVVLIREELLTKMPAPQAPARERSALAVVEAERAPQPSTPVNVTPEIEVQAAEPQGVTGAGQPEVIGHTSGGLPMRRRYSGAHAAVPEQVTAPMPPAGQVPESVDSMQRSASSLGAWQRGTARGQTEQASDHGKDAGE